VQPKHEDYEFELDLALSAVVGLRSTIHADAFTAKTLGTERGGNGVLISREGLVLTIGYLVVEAETVWISLADGRSVQGHVLAYDHDTGFGLVQALARLDLPWLQLGSSAAAEVGDSVILAGAGGPAHAVAAEIIAKQEFAGYWEYALDEAIFTAPSHSNWGGAALIGTEGDLIGIGSLQLQQTRSDGSEEDLNMVVPIDLLKPILKDLKTTGRANRPARPWIGLYATEMSDRLVVAGVSSRGPARAAEVRSGDIIMAVAGREVHTLGELFRRIWSLGEAGVEVPLLVYRNGRTMDIRVTSADRSSFFRSPTLH